MSNVDLAEDFIDSNPHNEDIFKKLSHQRFLLIESQIAATLNVLNHHQPKDVNLSRFSFFLVFSAQSSPIFPVSTEDPNTHTAFKDMIKINVLDDLYVSNVTIKNNIADYALSMVLSIFELGNNYAAPRTKILTDLISYKLYT